MHMPTCYHAATDWLSEASRYLCSVCLTLQVGQEDHFIRVPRTAQHGEFMHQQAKVRYAMHAQSGMHIHACMLGEGCLYVLCACVCVCVCVDFCVQSAAHAFRTVRGVLELLHTELLPMMLAGSDTHHGLSSGRHLTEERPWWAEDQPSPHTWLLLDDLHTRLSAMPGRTAHRLRRVLQQSTQTSVNCSSGVSAPPASNSSAPGSLASVAQPNTTCSSPGVSPMVSGHMPSHLY